MKTKNKTTIDNAFARFKKNKDEVIRAGMYGLLEDAVQIALAAHNEMHQAHIQIGDTYGWMLVHNHRIEEIAVVSTDDNRGKASRQLRQKLRDLPRYGWVGVVMAGMTPASYFAINYEIGTLQHTKNVIHVDFFKYFKPI